MHQTKYSANSLSHIKLAIRVFFLSVLLMGNTFLFISTMASNQIFAQGTTQTGLQHMTALQPHAVASANKILHTEKHIASQAQKESMGRQPVALNSSRKTSAQAAATPLPQNLSIAANVQGGPAFQVGQTLTFVLTVTNISPTTTLDATSGVRITDLIQLGLNSITGTASSGWNIITSAPNSPSLIQATYTGASVAPGAPFPQVTISGILTSDAVPTISNTAGVADNSNPNLSFATFSVNVSPSTETVTVTPTPTTAPASNPDVNLSFNVHGGPAFQVGQTLTFDMIVTNISTTVLDATSGVSTGTFTVPGLSNITAGGSGWTVIATSQNSPTFVQGVYGGPPVPPGGTFTPFQISATLNDAAIPAYTDTGGTADTQFPNPNLATFSVSVSPAPLTPTVVVSPSPTVVVSPSPTVVVSPSPTVVVSPSPTVVVSPSPTVVISPSPTVVVSPSPTVIGTPSPTATPPQLSIASSNPSGSTYTVGQTVNYQLVVTNQPTSLAKNQPIIVQEVFPVGLTNIVATGNNWSISLSNTTSPALITATYAGFYPVAPGTILPAISISGTLTAAAGPSFTSSASVNSADDPNPNPTLNTSTQTITVLGSTASPTVTSTATPTLPGTPLSSPTATIPPTLTGTPSPSPVVAETPTLPAGATPTTIAATTPNVSIVQSHLGGNHFHVGDTVSYVLIVSTASALATPITVTDVIPLGLSHMKVVAPGWLVTLSASSSPAVITATYTGVGLIRAGQILSPIIITGVLDGDAVPSLTNSATVGTLGNSNVYNTTAIDTVFVDTSSNSNNGDSSDNNQDNSNNNDSNNNDNNNQNNNNQNNNNQNHNNNSSNNTSFPGLPATGSDPAGA